MRIETFKKLWAGQKILRSQIAKIVNTHIFDIWVQTLPQLSRPPGGPNYAISAFLQTLDVYLGIFFSLFQNFNFLAYEKGSKIAKIAHFRHLNCNFRAAVTVPKSIYT